MPSVPLALTVIPVLPAVTVIPVLPAVTVIPVLPAVTVIPMPDAEVASIAWPLPLVVALMAGLLFAGLEIWKKPARPVPLLPPRLRATRWTRCSTR